MSVSQYVHIPLHLKSGHLELYDQSTHTNSIQILTPATITPYSLTLPSDNGVGDNLLLNKDTAGNLSWVVNTSPDQAVNHDSTPTFAGITCPVYKPALNGSITDNDSDDHHSLLTWRKTGSIVSGASAWTTRASFAFAATSAYYLVNVECIAALVGTNIILPFRSTRGIYIDSGGVLYETPYYDSISNSQNWILENDSGYKLKLKSDLTYTTSYNLRIEVQPLNDATVSITW